MDNAGKLGILGLLGTRKLIEQKESDTLNFIIRIQSGEHAQ